MELRQLRYFVKVIEFGSMSRAALDLNVVQSALSQQISKLESELATVLLHRSPSGVHATAAGLAFYQEAQLALRHSEQATRAAQSARLTGAVSIGLAPTTATMLGLPLIQAMHKRYPDVRVHIVESLSGHLSNLLNSRSLDIAVLFGTHGLVYERFRWQVAPLLKEQLFVMGAPDSDLADRIGDDQLAKLTFVLPSGPHGLRSVIDHMFKELGIKPIALADIDSLTILMQAVNAGIAYTIQPGSAAKLHPNVRSAVIEHPLAVRHNFLCSLPDTEISTAAIAARSVLIDCVKQLLKTHAWLGASHLES